MFFIPPTPEQENTLFSLSQLIFFASYHHITLLKCGFMFLFRESWKNNPAVKHVFSWTLQQVTRPWLTQHLERILPPSLLISDDYQTENKVLGVHCLHHIVLNVVSHLCSVTSVDGAA
jgi:hypothetical protein